MGKEKCVSVHMFYIIVIIAGGDNTGFGKRIEPRGARWSRMSGILGYESRVRRLGLATAIYFQGGAGDEVLSGQISDRAAHVPGLSGAF